MATIWTPIDTSAPPPTEWAQKNTVVSEAPVGTFNGTLVNMLPLNGG